VVSGFCKDVRALEPALWTFATVDGVEPTNNAAERALRPAVLWRKGCFGADSTDGTSFVAKILTATATCRQQQRHLLTYLTDAVSAYRDGQPAPSRIPG
jgi:transposase